MEQERGDSRRIAFGLNCLQLASCGRCWRMPRKPSLVSFPDFRDGHYPHKTWMQELVEREKDYTGPKATLKRMVIPGSHDSGSYSISNRIPFSAIAKTQNLTIRQQLLSGVRFLDLRIASGKMGGVNIYHGRLMGCKFEETLAQIQLFCMEHRKEFIIVYVQAEYGQRFAPKDKKAALDMMKARFGSRNDDVSQRLLCKVRTRSELIDTPLGKLIETKGRVCVLLRSRIYDDFVVNGVKYNKEFVEENYGFFDYSKWLRDKWHNTTNTLELLESNLREIRRHKANIRRYFVNNQFVLTPAFDANDLCDYVIGKASLQPVQLANQGLYQAPAGSNGMGVPVLHEMFVGHPEDDWNVLSLDFVDLAPAAIQLWIGMNFGPFEIELALLGNTKSTSRRSAEDVTEIMRSKIIRNSCLLLHPLWEFDPVDLAVPDNTLTLVYRVSGKLYSIVVTLSELVLTQVVVLNEQNHLLAGGEELTIGENQGNGIINPQRRSGLMVTWQKTEQKSFRFGYVDDDGTEISME